MIFYRYFKIFDLMKIFMFYFHKNNYKIYFISLDKRNFYQIIDEKKISSNYCCKKKKN